MTLVDRLRVLAAVLHSPVLKVSKNPHLDAWVQAGKAMKLPGPNAATRRVWSHWGSPGSVDELPGFPDTLEVCYDTDRRGTLQAKATHQGTVTTFVGRPKGPWSIEKLPSWPPRAVTRERGEGLLQKEAILGLVDKLQAMLRRGVAHPNVGGTRDLFIQSHSHKQLVWLDVSLEIPSSIQSLPRLQRRTEWAAQSLGVREAVRHAEEGLRDVLGDVWDVRLQDMLPSQFSAPEATEIWRIHCRLPLDANLNDAEDSLQDLKRELPSIVGPLLREAHERDAEETGVAPEVHAFIDAMVPALNETLTDDVQLSSISAESHGIQLDITWHPTPSVSRQRMQDALSFIGKSDVNSVMDELSVTLDSSLPEGVTSNIVPILDDGLEIIIVLTFQDDLSATQRAAQKAGRAVAVTFHKVYQQVLDWVDEFQAEAKQGPNEPGDSEEAEE